VKIVRLALQVIGALAVLGVVLTLAVAAFLAPKLMERINGATR